MAKTPPKSPSKSPSKTSKSLQQPNFAPAAGFTDTRRVKELIALMADNGLTEIELVEDKSRIVLRRGTSTGAPAAAPIHYAPVAGSGPASSSGAAAAAPAASKAVDEEKLVPIRASMVGTFYSAPSPDAGPYVSIGSVVDAKTVVCIIEAMKVFNPIEAEISGTIAKVLVNNGQAVEFNQPLFLVRPS